MRAPDVTNTPAGVELVEIMADGVLDYMEANNIPVTEEGFKQVVEKSREGSINGKIAFLSDTARERIASFVQKHTGLESLLFGNASSKKPSIRERFMKWHLTPDDTTIPEEVKAEYLSYLRAEVGDDVFAILEASRFGDCQRRLVWKRIQEKRLSL